YRLPCDQRSGSRIVIEYGDRIGELVNDIDLFAVGVECQVPGSGTRWRANERLSVRRKFGGVCIDQVAQNLVETQIRRVSKAVAWADNDTVGVGPFLPGGIDARAFVL